MALAPRYHPTLSRQPHNILADVPTESLVNCKRISVTKEWSRTVKVGACIVIFLAYITSPRFLSFYRRDGLVNMWQNSSFLMSFIPWIFFVSFLVISMFVDRRHPQIWRDKTRQILASWDRGTVLVLGSPYNMGVMIFAEEVSLSDKVKDTFFVCIDRFEQRWWDVYREDLALLFLSLGIPVSTNVVAHSLTLGPERKATKVDDTIDNSDPEQGLSPEDDLVVQYDQLPFDANSMDVVLSCEALYTGPSKKFSEEGLAESLRVVKPGGRVVVMINQPLHLGRSKKMKAYLELAGVDLTVERHGSYLFYNITKPMVGKFVA
ncbi:hypothetical protein FRB91_005005 [Serendipita sp. 411]|nr:hypothetical protein FRB91_005005 [Serendipita sp. 411]